MPTPSSQIGFVYTDYAKYHSDLSNNLIDPDSIYFLKDTKQIYIGDVALAPASKSSSGKGVVLSGNPQSIDQYQSVVDDDSLLVTSENRSFDMIGSLGIFGQKISVSLSSSASANTTTYNINTSVESVIYKIASVGGVLSEDGKTIILVTAINTTNHTITTVSSANPTSSVNSITVVGGGIPYTTNSGKSNLVIGGGAKSEESITVGSNYTEGINDLTVGDGNINVKNNTVMIGQGHDNTSGPNDGTYFGRYSDIGSTTAFAVGNGTSTSQRSNLMSVMTDGRVKSSGTPTENNDLTTKAYVDSLIQLYNGSVTVINT